MAQTIKIIIALAGLALLTACWGLKRPSPVTGAPSETCATNPFQSTCDEEYAIARVLKISECIAGGAAATLTCRGAVAANSCISDPFATACATNDSFSPYLARARNERAVYCVADNANATLCASVAGSAQLDNDCLDSPVGAPVNASCASRPSVVLICADDPFTRPGCGNVSTIDALRTAHCEDPLTAWDDDCVEATYTVAVAARDMACLEYGISVSAGGHADCAERDNVLLACSETSPFAHDVCDEVEEIGMKRMTFCLKTDDNNGENPFNDGCEQTVHGDVSGAQMASCLVNVDADDGCEALIMKTCEDTPLAGVSCATLDGYTEDLNMFCSTGNNAMLGGCAMTPARLSACTAGTLGSSECDTDVIAPKVCASSGPNANPFVDFCTSTNNIGGGDYTAIRQTALSTCFDGMSDDDNDICQNTIMARRTLATDCMSIGDTFKDRCDYDEFDDERMGFCTSASTAWNPECTDSSHGDPTEARGQACVDYGTDTSRGGHATCTTDYADWTGSTFTPEFPLIAVTAATSSDTLNQFLSGLTKGAAVPTITGFTPLATTGDPVKANATNHLALNDTVHGFAGEDDDGVMFFGGQRTDSTYRYYAGIYSSTDVGLPLTDASQNGVWRAWMRTSGKDPKNEYFELGVVFDTSNNEGTLVAFFESTSGGNTLSYDIGGEFGVNGVITGDILIGTESSGSILDSDNEYTTGKLTGLIGVDGVVAAFVSNTKTVVTTDELNPFVGGFVGIPAVADHDVFSHHYKTQLNTVLTTGEVAFAEGSAVGLVNTGLTFTSTDGEFDTFPVMEAGDGFALMFGQTAGGDDRYRAGLLSGTDLGAPLMIAPIDMTWDGSVYVSRHLDGTTDLPMEVSVTLNVDFVAGTIGTASAVTTAMDETITIIGQFGAGDATLPLGILGGTVTYNDGTDEHADLPLIGLIGVDGAIGVFHGGSDIDMVGGFSVKPTP